MHLFWYGLLIGWGGAIPFGPINLEIVRRNLTYGTRYGIAFGIGACAVDASFMILISIGALTILSHPLVIKIGGCFGAISLIWFGVKALRAKPQQLGLHIKPHSQTVWRSMAESYMMAISSPFSIIFWTSIGSQIALLAHTASYGLEWMVLGVILATISWDFLLNGFLHLARHRLPQAIIHWFNRLGGVILISMALFSLWYVFDKIKF